MLCMRLRYIHVNLISNTDIDNVSRKSKYALRRIPGDKRNRSRAQLPEEMSIGVGDGGAGGGQLPPPPNSGKNYFFRAKIV